MTVAVATRDGHCSYRVRVTARTIVHAPVATAPPAIPGGFAVMVPVPVSLPAPDSGSFPVPVLTGRTAVLAMVSVHISYLQLIRAPGLQVMPKGKNAMSHYKYKTTL